VIQYPKKEKRKKKKKSAKVSYKQYDYNELQKPEHNNV